jgi:hypothetical protein
VKRLFQSTGSISWIDSVRGVWSVDFSQAVAQRLVFVANQLQKGTKQYFYCTEFAQYLHPSLLETWHLNPDLQQVMLSLEQSKNNAKAQNWYIEHFLSDLKNLISTLETRAHLRKELLS